MKLNFVGIVGGIIAFISVILPWWTMTFSYSAIPYSVDLSVYLYQMTMMGVSMGAMVSWYCWVALALVIVGGILGILGSVTKYGKRMISGGAAVALVSIIIFAVGLQLELVQGSSQLSEIGITGVGLFSSGSITVMDVSMNFTTYLTYGFWLALVSAIIMFAALKTHPKEPVPTPQPVFAPQPPPPSPEPPPPST